MDPGRCRRQMQGNHGCPTGIIAKIGTLHPRGEVVLRGGGKRGQNERRGCLILSRGSMLGHLSMEHREIPSCWDLLTSSILEKMMR